MTQEIKPKLFSNFPEVTHSTSTRGHGDLTFFKRKKLHTVERRLGYFHKLGLDLNKLVVPEQVHGSKVKVVTLDDAGRGAFDYNTEIKGYDGLITQDVRLVLGVKSGDCVPIFLYDPIKGVIGLAHAGWQGTLGNIAGNLVKATAQNFNSQPKNIYAYFGPSICAESFDITEYDDVKKRINKLFSSQWRKHLLKTNGKRIFVDLQSVIVEQLKETGMLEKNIEVSSDCTVKKDKKFYSHYRERERRSGGHLSVISLHAVPIKEREVTVMGLGSYGGGVATVNWLERRGAKVTLTDLKSKAELENSLNQINNLSEIKLVLGGHDKKDFTEADLVVKNPAVPDDSRYLKIARDNKVPVEMDSSIFVLACPVSVIGVTGTKGKSTTTHLIQNILRTAGQDVVTVGFDREAVLDKLDGLGSDSRVLFEMSSWRLEAFRKHKISPQISVVTNINKEHLNRHGSFANYIEAKKIIFKYQASDDWAILNYDDPIIRSWDPEIKSQKFWFSLRALPKGKDGVYIKNNLIVIRQNSRAQEICSTKDIFQAGEHNLANALAAIAVAKVSGISEMKIYKSLREFKPLESRLQFIRELNGVSFINDSTATTPYSTLAALNSFQKSKIILIAGGAKNTKKADFSELTRFLKKHKTKVVAVPGLGPKILPAYVKTQNLSSAVKKAVSLARPGDFVIFSPSVTWLPNINEFERGENFREIVESL